MTISLRATLTPCTQSCRHHIVVLTAQTNCPHIFRDIQSLYMYVCIPHNIKLSLESKKSLNFEQLYYHSDDLNLGILLPKPAEFALHVLQTRSYHTTITLHHRIAHRHALTRLTRIAPPASAQYFVSSASTDRNTPSGRVTTYAASY